MQNQNLQTNQPVITNPSKPLKNHPAMRTKKKIPPNIIKPIINYGNVVVKVSLLCAVGATMVSLFWLGSVSSEYPWVPQPAFARKNAFQSFMVSGGHEPEGVETLVNWNSMVWSASLMRWRRSTLDLSRRLLAAWLKRFITASSRSCSFYGR